MLGIWAYLDGPDGGDSPEIDLEMDPEMGSKYDPESDLESDTVALDRLFQLNCLFWVNGSTAGNMAPLPLVYFSGVLGIHRHSLAYRTAYHYTHS
jgi:hypothetical protein